MFVPSLVHIKRKRWAGLGWTAIAGLVRTNFGNVRFTIDYYRLTIDYYPDKLQADNNESIISSHLSIENFSFLRKIKIKQNFSFLRNFFVF